MFCHLTRKQYNNCNMWNYTVQGGPRQMSSRGLVVSFQFNCEGRITSLGLMEEYKHLLQMTNDWDETDVLKMNDGNLENKNTGFF